MIDEWLAPLYKLYDGGGYYYLQSGVPSEVTLLLHITIIGVFAVWVAYDRKDYVRKALILLLADYIVFLIFSTILFRSENAVAGCKLMPFWTYIEILSGKDHLAMEVILNILVFIPIGLLSSSLFKRGVIVKTLSIGLSVSLIIELGQFIFGKGIAEIDDVIHNTLGTVIGYIITQSVVWIWNKLILKKSIQ